MCNNKISYRKYAKNAREREEVRETDREREREWQAQWNILSSHEKFN